MIGVLLAVAILTLLVYLGGKIDISFMEQEAKMEINFHERTNLNSSKKQNKGNYHNISAGRTTWFTTPGFSQK